MSLFEDGAGTPASGATEPRTWEQLRDDAAGCQACPLWEAAGATVFGEGPVPARIMLVGEQPGDQEDRQGRPFVGPAGRVLDQGLEAIGLDRSTVYVTNAVKHFKFTQRGKRRIHQTPTASESAACRPWLRSELAVVRPELLVLLGATAAKSLMGPGFRITKERGVPLDCDAAPHVVATIHPSAVLRGPVEDREDALGALVGDLRTAVALLG